MTGAPVVVTGAPLVVTGAPLVGIGLVGIIVVGLMMSDESEEQPNARNVLINWKDGMRAEIELSDFDGEVGNTVPPAEVVNDGEPEGGKVVNEVGKTEGVGEGDAVGMGRDE